MSPETWPSSGGIAHLDGDQLSPLKELSTAGETQCQWLPIFAGPDGAGIDGAERNCGGIINGKLAKNCPS